MGRSPTLGARDLVETMTCYRDALIAHRDAINRLNVYPVPDGDTGTNMSLTLESVVAEVAQLGSRGGNGSAPAETMTEVCKAVSHGSLMGARGNSGVILSQILRGMTDVLRTFEAAGPEELAAALSRASDAANDAVMRPVEGTILTVARAAARAARETAVNGASLEDVLDAARISAADTLERTPEMLPVLAEAGVVDAGGAGYVLLFDSLLHVVADRPVPEPTADEGVVVSTYGAAAMITAAAGADGSDVGEEDRAPTDLRFEVMYLLEAQDAMIPAFKEVWATIGDSIVVVGGDGLWNCHIHTNEIGPAIEAGVEAGRPKRIRVTDLVEEVEEERWVREAAAVSGEDVDLDMEAVAGVLTAVVAVTNGSGIRRIFRSLGVHRFVTGGQSMNPSTQDLLAAIDAGPAPDVVVLPNNPNIIPVAKAAAEVSAKNVVVVPTRGVPQAFAALFEYDPQATAEQNALSMTSAAGRVVYGEITRAVRATNADGFAIEEGDWLGMSDARIEAVDANLGDLACALLEKLVTADKEVVTIIEGEGATAAVTRRMTEWLSDNRPGVESEVHRGGQPLYPYLLGID